METKMTVRFDSQEVVGKMLELLTEQHKASAQASEQVNEDFDDWLWLDDAVENPTGDPTLSISNRQLAQALLAANDIDVGFFCAETEILEGGDLKVHYWS